MVIDNDTLIQLVFYPHAPCVASIDVLPYNRMVVV